MHVEFFAGDINDADTAAILIPMDVDGRADRAVARAVLARCTGDMRIGPRAQVGRTLNQSAALTHDTGKAVHLALTIGREPPVEPTLARIANCMRSLLQLFRSSSLALVPLAGLNMEEERAARVMAEVLRDNYTPNQHLQRVVFVERNPERLERVRAAVLDLEGFPPPSQRSPSAEVDGPLVPEPFDHKVSERFRMQRYDSCSRQRPAAPVGCMGFVFRFESVRAVAEMALDVDASGLREVELNEELIDAPRVSLELGTHTFRFHCDGGPLHLNFRSLDDTRLAIAMSPVEVTRPAGTRERLLLDDERRVRLPLGRCQVALRFRVAFAL